MTFDTDDEVRESVALARMIARMTHYTGVEDDGGAAQLVNRLIDRARGIFADKPQDDEDDEEAA